MNKINKIRLHNNYIVTRKNMNEKDDMVELTIEYDLDCEKKGFSEYFIISINRDGKIVESSSLVSSRNSLDYYLAMGEILSKIKEIETKGFGANIFKTLEEIEEQCDKECELEIDKLEDSLIPFANLETEIKNMSGKLRRLRKQEKKDELEKEINEKRNQYDKINRHNKTIRRQVEAKRENSRIKMIEKINNWLENNIVKNLYEDNKEVL